MHFSIDGTVHTTAFDKPVVDHWFKKKKKKNKSNNNNNNIAIAKTLEI